jgi:very-short-patch-repair endonuclease
LLIIRLKLSSNEKVKKDLLEIEIQKPIGLPPSKIGELVEYHKAGELKYPYYKKFYFFSDAERNFYKILVEIAKYYNLIVFAKVRMEDLLHIPKYTRNILKWRGYVRSRHVDFVLCESNTISPIGVIELDDSSHGNEESAKVDKLKNNIFASAGLPLLRVRVSREYDTAEIDNKIRSIVYPTQSNVSPKSGN